MSYRAASAIEQVAGYIDARSAQFHNSIGRPIRELVEIRGNPSASLPSISKLRFNYFIKAQEGIAIMDVIEAISFTPKCKCFADMIVINNRHVVTVEGFDAGNAY